MLLHKGGKFGSCLFSLFRLPHDVQHLMLQRGAVGIDHHHLAATLEGGVDRQNPATRDRRLEKEMPQIAGEHLNRMPLTVLSNLPAELPFQARQNQPADRIPNAAGEKAGVRMPLRNHQRLSGGLHFVGRPLNLHSQNLRPLATIDRQPTVRRNPLHMLGVVKVVAIVLGVFGDRLAFRLEPLAPQLANLLQEGPQPLADIGAGRDLFSKDVAHAEQGVGGGRHLPVGVDEVCGPSVEVCRSRIGREDLTGQRLKPPLPSDLCERAFLGFERKVEVFKLLAGLGGQRRFRQLRRQLSLVLDAPEHRLLAISQLTSPGDCVGDPSDRHLVKAARLIPAVPGDKRDRVASIEEGDHPRDPRLRQAKPFRQSMQIDRHLDDRRGRTGRRRRRRIGVRGIHAIRGFGRPAAIFS